jgi:uncharacterized coiled-coil protein SlyX
MMPHKLILIPLLLVCLGLAPMADAVGPDTEGNIPGANNGEGVGVLVSRTTGVWNTGTGFEALNNLTAGNQNTATGLRALFSDINGGFNTATGVYSLYSNTAGFFNSATGAYSLTNNTEGTSNTANGYSALYFNSVGDVNTATGFAALYRNTTGTGNTANGYQALTNNTSGVFNDAHGWFALRDNQTGIWNVAVGAAALANNVSGSFNTAIGVEAGADITGDGNVCIGDEVRGEAGPSDRTYIRNIRGGIVGNGDGINVIIDSDGQLGTTNSSRRFKKDIKAMDQTSEAILALKPVTFHYKDQDTKKAEDTRQYGLIAEDVVEVSPDLVVTDSDGQLLTVRYDAVNAMLLNEFLKEHRKVEAQQSKIEKQEATITELKSTVAQQQKGMEVLTTQLKEQAAQI